MRTKTTWCVLAAVLLTATACNKNETRPDDTPTQDEAADAPATTGATDAQTDPLLTPATATEIEAFRKSEIGGTKNVFVYLSPGGVAIDGEDALTVDPKTRRFRPEDKKGGAGALYLEALTPKWEAASRARTFTTDDSNPRLIADVFVEPSVRARMLVEVLYSMDMDLRPTVDGSDDRMVEMGVGGGSPSTPMKFATRREGGWRVVNTVKQSLAVGPGVEEPDFTLALRATPKGVAVAVDDAALPPVAGCPADGPTVCNAGGADASELIAKVDASSGAARDAALAELVALYDLRSLYNVALTVKAKHPDETVMTVSADPEAPVALIDAIIHAVRYTRASEADDGTFADDASFAAAPSSPSDELFSDPVLGL